MDTLLQLIKDYGLGIVVFVYFMYLFNKQNKKMETDSLDAKEKNIALEKKIDDLNEFVVKKLMETVDKNDKAYTKMCESNDQVCKVISGIAEKLDRKRSTDQEEKSKK